MDLRVPQFNGDLKLVPTRGIYVFQIVVIRNVSWLLLFPLYMTQLAVA
jgi:hypothetical protein